jgi:hypothetical protein
MRTKLLIIFVIVFCSCGRKSTNETVTADSVLKIDLFSEPVSEITRVSDIATELTYIPLQTTENSLVKSITKILTSDNKIYIRNGNSDILCFDRKGKFLYKFNKTGRGPGEYNFIGDFDISSDNKILIVISDGNLLIYNITGEEFIFNKSINLMHLFQSNSQPYPSKISIIPGTANILLSIDPFTGSEQFLSILINIDGDSLYFKPNHYMYGKTDVIRQMINESLQYNFENKVCFKEEFSDTVFFVNKETNKFQPRLIFDSHGKGFLPRIRYDKEYARSHAAENFWVYLIIETPRYIIYTYEHNKIQYKILYDKSADKNFKLKEWDYFNHVASKKALKDDINGGPDFDLDFCSENLVYSSVDALTLKTYVASDAFKNALVKDPKKKNELKKLADSLNETDNHVLIVVTPKE